MKTIQLTYQKQKKKLVEAWSLPPNFFEKEHDVKSNKLIDRIVSEKRLEEQLERIQDSDKGADFTAAIHGHEKLYGSFEQPENDDENFSVDLQNQILGNFKTSDKPNAEE